LERRTNTPSESLKGELGEIDKRDSIQFESVRGEIRGRSEKTDLVHNAERFKVDVAELERRRLA
jgi:hypothetical protein